MKRIGIRHSEMGFPVGNNNNKGPQTPLKHPALAQLKGCLIFNSTKKGYISLLLFWSPPSFVTLLHPSSSIIITPTFDVCKEDVWKGFDHCHYSCTTATDYNIRNIFILLVACLFLLARHNLYGYYLKAENHFV